MKTDLGSFCVVKHEGSGQSPLAGCRLWTRVVSVPLHSIFFSNTNQSEPGNPRIWLCANKTPNLFPVPAPCWADFFQGGLVVAKKDIGMDDCATGSSRSGAAMRLLGGKFSIRAHLYEDLFQTRAAPDITMSRASE